MVVNALPEWRKWEAKLLLYGEVEAKSSKMLEKKLTGKCIENFFFVAIVGFDFLQA